MAMTITLTVSSIDEARQARVLLHDYIMARRAEQRRAEQAARFDNFPETSTRTPLAFLELTARAHNCLVAAGIDTVEKLCRQTPNELLKLPNLGLGTLNDIKTDLAAKGHKLAG
jgi:DNA-directed RNA polymerase alpha subunit